MPIHSSSLVLSKWVALWRPPNLYFVTALPSKTPATANIDANCLISWCTNLKQTLVHHQPQK